MISTALKPSNAALATAKYFRSEDDYVGLLRADQNL